MGVLGEHLGGLELSVESLVPSLGASLGHLGPSWVPLGYTLANFGPSKVILDPPPSLILEPLGTNFGPQWADNSSSSRDQKVSSDQRESFV